MKIDKKKLVWLVNGGLLVAIVLLAWIFGPGLLMELKYREAVKQQQNGQPTLGFSALMYTMRGITTSVDGVIEEATEVQPGFEDMIGEPVIIPISPEFGLVIPKIFANVAVTENVNPADAQEYQEVLRHAGGVAHAAGSVFPGEEGVVYIFGHSTDSNINVERYNAVFYLLRKLEAGDLIMAYYRGTPYNYRVVEKKTVEPTDISDITDVGSQKKLVLQTCWPPGTTWKRLLVIAKLEE